MSRRKGRQLSSRREVWSERRKVAWARGIRRLAAASVVRHASDLVKVVMYRWCLDLLVAVLGARAFD